MRGMSYVPHLLLAVGLSAFAGICAAAPPDDKTGVVVLGQKKEVLPPIESQPIKVTPGRFIPLMPLDGSPSYIAPSPAYRVYKIPAGGSFTGIKYDSPADAEPEAFSWPDVKGPVYVLLARNHPGKAPVQLLKNGPPDIGPVENGAALSIEVLGGPQPPPVPVPVPVPVPTPTDALSQAIQTAFAAEPATYVDPADPTKTVWDKATCVSRLGALYSNAATTTVQDPTVKTYGTLFNDLETASRTLLPKGAIPGVRKVVGQHINSTLGTGPTMGPTANTPINRDLTSAEFLKIGTALKGVK